MAEREYNRLTDMWIGLGSGEVYCMDISSEASIAGKEPASQLSIN